MGNKCTGNLFYDAEIGRYDIRFSTEEYYGGLHCGDCIEVLVNGEWIPTRIEMGEQWYLVGIQTRLDGLTVKM